MSIIMNRLYRTWRIYFSLHACFKLEFMTNMCLHQVGAIKNDSINGSKKLERRGKNVWMDEHNNLYDNYPLSNLKCSQIEFLTFREKCWNLSLCRCFITRCRDFIKQIFCLTQKYSYESIYNRHLLIFYVA
jgi:hypothetical protein